MGEKAVQAASGKAPDKDAEQKVYRPARQSRSAETERRFLEAAEQLFADHGYAGTRIADIISRSGCSTGSFYHRFVDKEGLFRVLLKRYLEYSEQQFQDIDLSREAVGNLYNLFWELAELVREGIYRNRGFYRAARELSLGDPAIWQSLRDLTGYIGQYLDGVYPEYADEITASEPQAAFRHAGQLIIMITLNTELGDGPLFPKDRTVFLKMLADAAYGVVRPEKERR